jgi:hypothetical protein
MELLAVSFGNDFWLQFAQKIFQPLLLFFYLGFLIPILKVPYQFPKQIYQGITLYLLVAIGWHGGAGPFNFRDTRRSRGERHFEGVWRSAW